MSKVVGILSHSHILEKDKDSITVKDYLKNPTKYKNVKYVNNYISNPIMTPVIFDCSEHSAEENNKFLLDVYHEMTNRCIGFNKYKVATLAELSKYMEVPYKLYIILNFDGYFNSIVTKKKDKNDEKEKELDKTQKKEKRFIKMKVNSMYQLSGYTGIYIEFVDSAVFTSIEDKK